MRADVDDELVRRAMEAEIAAVGAPPARPVACAVARAYAVQHLIAPADRGRPLLVVAEWQEPKAGAEARRAVDDERRSLAGPPRAGSAPAIVAGHLYDHVRVEFADGMDGEDLFEITIEDGARVVLVDRFNND